MRADSTLGRESGAWLHAGPAFGLAEGALLDALLAEGRRAWVVAPAARKAAEISARLGEGSPVEVSTMREIGAGLLVAAGDCAVPVPTSVVPALTAEALREGAPLGDVGRFPGLARRVADLVATLKRYGYATPRDLAQGLDRVRGGAPAPVRDRRLVEGFEAYARALGSRRDPADVSLAAARVLEGGGGEVPRRVLILGFHDLDGVQRRMVRALAQRTGRLDLVCDHEPASTATTATDALVSWAASWMRPASALGPPNDPPARADRRRLAAVLFADGEDDAPAGCVELVEADDALTEVTALARSLAERRAWEGGRRVAAVFPDLGRYAPLIREVFPRFDVPFDLAHGAPLLDTPVGRSAMVALEFVAEGLPRRGLYDVATAPFLRIRGKAGDLWAGWLDGQAREAGVVGGGGRPRREWLEVLEARVVLLAAGGDRRDDADMLTRQIRVLRAFFRTTTPLRRPAAATDLAASVAKFLDSLGLFARAGRPSEGVSAELVREERSALEALEASLVEAPMALEAAGPIDLGRLVAALRADWGGRAVRLPGDPGGVRVLGRLEPRSLEFDELHVGGLSSDRFPGGAVQGGGVLSERDRAALGLPAADKRMDEARHMVYRALLAPREALTLSWPAREGGTPLQPADWIADIQTWTGTPPRVVPAGAVGPRAEGLIRQGQGLEASPDAAAARGMHVAAVRRGEGPSSPWEGRLSGDPAVRDDLAAQLAADVHVFSPSQLEQALNCPFAWFADRILGLSVPEEEEDDDALPALWGDLVHRVLARWALDPASTDPAEARMARAVSATLTESPWREMVGPFWEAQRDALERGLLARFLESEAQGRRSPTHAELRFGPAARDTRDLEDPRSTDDALLLGAGPRSVRIAGRIDRMDAGDGWVFDYKTGRPPSIAAVGSGASVQLPLYLMAARRMLGLPLTRATWYRLRPDRVGPGARAWPPRGDDVDGALAEVEDRVVEGVEALRQGEMGLVPDGTKACPPRCPYARMCRVDDRRLVAARRADP